jgi:DNA-binding transcriptional regulator YiaG
VSLRFRNLDVTPAAPVETWPTEGFLAAIERGFLSDWRRIVAAVRRDPWGPVARRLEQALEVSEAYGTRPLLERALARARADAAAAERTEVARRVRALLDASGLSRAAFAASIGTSAPRLSTYLSGKVAPSSTLLVRMERIAGVGNASPEAATVPR